MTGGPDDHDRGAAERAGLALGPMTFVAEFRVTGADDPWAHRKGEPRVFALVWAVYLLGAAVLTVFSVRALGYPRASQFVFGGLSMLTLSMFGIMGLWPALRLSQVRAAQPVLAAALDVSVVLLPIHAIVWPMSMLTGWRWPTTLGVLLAMSGWALVAGGVIALTLVGGGTRAARLLAMLVLLVMCAGAPALRVLMMRSGQSVPPAVDLWSPLSAPWALGLARDGVHAQMTGPEWWAGIAPTLAGMVLFAGSLATRRDPISGALPGRPAPLQ